ncbi:hypothetical protein [uncultured Psychrobacter sp.]|uniref:hypothetical protein n=1 Tax=uncultured Psychrobacter sp. TaxID=259303 RepID=UPI0030DDBFA2
MTITNLMIIGAVLAFIALRVALYFIARPESIGKKLTEDMPAQELASHTIDIAMATRMKMRLYVYIIAFCAAILIALLISNAGGDSLIINQAGYSYSLTFRTLIGTSIACGFYLIGLLGRLKTANDLLDVLELDNGVSIDKLLDEKIEENKPDNIGKHQ